MGSGFPFLGEVKALKQSLNMDYREVASRLMILAEASSLLGVSLNWSIISEPLHHPSVVGLKEGLSQLSDDWTFQISWTIRILNALDQTPRKAVEELQIPTPPYTAESVLELLKQLRDYRESNTSIWRRWWPYKSLHEAERAKLMKLQKFENAMPFSVMDLDIRARERTLNIEFSQASLYPFMRGSSGDEGYHQANEQPMHKVDCNYRMLVLKTPVRQSLYQMIMKRNPSLKKNPQQPVESLSWYDALHFCNALSEYFHLPEAYYIEGKNVETSLGTRGYRLLTESEWEFMAKGGSEMAYAGSDFAANVAWTPDNSQNQIKEVAKKLPNGFGLFDMSGLVREWCWDRYGPYEASALPLMGPEAGRKRVVRGGSFRQATLASRCAARDKEHPEQYASDLGFRICRRVD